MTLDPRAVAHALGGNVSGCRVIAPGPGHSRLDRSLAIKIEPNAPDGFVCHSFAGDDWRECRDHVCQAIQVGTWERPRRRSLPRCPTRSTALADDGSSDRTALALHLWNEARDPRDTNVVVYFAARGLTLSDDVAGDVIRFHPNLKFESLRVGGMLALFRDVWTNEPCGIHRTFLDRAGRKLDRKMLGRAKG